MLAILLLWGCGDRVVERYDRELSAQGITLLDIRAVHGDVEVKGTGGDDIVAKVKLRDGNDELDGDVPSDTDTDTDVPVETDNPFSFFDDDTADTAIDGDPDSIATQSASVALQYGPGGSALFLAAFLFDVPDGYYFDVKLKVPERMAISGQLVTGEAQLKKVGGANLRTIAGDIDVRGVEGPVSIVDGDGRIDIKDVVGRVEVVDDDGKIVIKDVDGSIAIDDGDDKIKIVDVQGNVVIDDGKGNIVVKRVDGDVTIAGDTKGSVRLKDISGSTKQ